MGVGGEEGGGGRSGFPKWTTKAFGPPLVHET